MACRAAVFLDPPRVEADFADLLLDEEFCSLLPVGIQRCKNVQWCAKNVLAARRLLNRYVDLLLYVNI